MSEPVLHPASKLRPEVTAQFIKFSIAGFIATVATYAVLITLVELWEVDAVLASIVGYVAGTVVNYILNYRFTFRSDQRHHIVVPKFLLVKAIGLLLIWSYTAKRLWAFAR